MEKTEMPDFDQDEFMKHNEYDDYDAWYRACMDLDLDRDEHDGYWYHNNEQKPRNNDEY